MINPIIPMDRFPGLAYDGTITFSGVLQSYFNIKHPTGSNIGISKEWNDDTATRYLRDYNRRILPLINELFGSQKPMHEFTESDFEAILSELENRNHYPDSVVMHYRHLLWCTYAMGVTQNLYPDIIYWDDLPYDLDPENDENYRIKALTRIRKSLSVKEEIKFLMWATSLDPKTVKGEHIGIVLMYFLSIRDNEACGCSYGDFKIMDNHSDMAVYIMGNTTGIGTNKLQPRGKTGNAPRQIPTLIWLYSFIQKRKEWLQSMVDSGDLILPDGVESVDYLPVVCKDFRYLERADSSDLSRSGRLLFQRMGISKSELAELQRILLTAEFRETKIEEKNATLYLLRRNASTRLYHCGFDRDTIQFWIGHEIENQSVLRNFYADEDVLYEVGKKYFRHPIFHILKLLTSEKQSEPHFENHGTSDIIITSERHLIDVEATEPNTPISIHIKSDLPFSVNLTIKEAANSVGDVVSILQFLQKEYLCELESVLQEIKKADNPH